MHTLPTLPYEYKVLEPHFDARTMEIHHTKHHQAYVDKLNAALEKFPDLQNKPIDDLLRDFANVPQEIQTAVRNHGGGHSNHSLFWTILTPHMDTLPEGELATLLQSTFGSFADFQQQFATAAVGQFGSGWAWLVVNADGTLAIISTPNQDSPLIKNQTPILGLDVWEHAYYLNYQNRRSDYIQAFWHIVNWTKVAKNYTAAINRPVAPPTTETPHH